MEALYKRKHEEVINIELVKQYEKQDLEKINKAIKEAKEGRFSRVETIANKGDGTTFPVLLNFSPVKNKDGDIINIIVTATDITDIKNREEEYKKVVEEATKAMEYISSGEYTIRIGTDYKQDDLKLLTETLNMVIEYLGKTDEDLKNLIKELATPAIEVMKGVVVMPLVGRLTSDRALDAMDNILNKIEATKAKVGIIDITGVPGIDSAVADNLIKSIESIKLIGAIPILSGIGAETAKNLVRIGIKFDFVTKSNLSEALDYAITTIK
jgi:anti-anti-sigma regulatory factor